MRLYVNFKHAAACVAAIAPVALVALTLAAHSGFARQHPHHASGPHANANPDVVHHAAPGGEDHLIGWVNHLVLPFTLIAANL